MTNQLNNHVAATVRRPLNLLILALLLLAITAGCFFQARLNARYDLSRLRIREQLSLDHGVDAVLQELNSLRKELIFISQVPELEDFITEPDNRVKIRQLSEGLASLARSKKNYDQIRFISKSGMEVIRIEYNNGQPLIVPDNELQDKGQRYYFIDTMSLDKNEIYFSPIDLNIEHGKIELPHKPMLRIATPVFAANGKKQGIIILNYFARLLFNHFLQNLADLKHKQFIPGQPMILNPDGYWLLAQDSDDEWGFMLDKRKTFGKRYPDAWKLINKNERGQFQTADGMFSYRKLYFMPADELVGSGTAEPFQTSNKTHAGSKYYLIFLSHIPAADLQLLSPLQRFSWKTYTAIVVTLLPLFFFLLVQAEHNRQSRQKLRDSEARFRLLYENAPIAYQSLDREGVIKSVNNNWLDLMGYEATDVIDRPFFNFISPKTDEDFLQKFSQFRAGGKTCETELKLRKKDNTDILVSFSGNIYTDKKGNFLQTHCVFSDVTELRSKEEKIVHLNLVLKTIMKIQQLISTEKDPAILIDKTCNLLTKNRGYNSAWIVLLDKKTNISNSAFTGLNYNFNALENNIQAGQLPACIKTLKKEGEVKIFKHRNKLCKDCPFAEKYLKNSVMAVSLSHADTFLGYMVVQVASELLSEHEEKDVFAEIAHDLAYGLYVMEQEGERQKMKDQLMLTEKMTTIAGLAAGVAHELNTPLSGIMQSIQIIDEGLRPSDPLNIKTAKEYDVDLNKLQNYLISRNINIFLAGIRESAARAAKIINSLLRFSRPGQTEIIITSLTDILDSAILLARTDYDMKKKYKVIDVEFIKDYGSKPISLACVSMEIEQVILNILKNAIQAMAGIDKTGFHPRIILRTATFGTMARIEIEDNGPGIDDKTRSKIFDPFFTTKEVGKGTGLGLYISYNIIRGAHKGRLWVESTSGKKTTFFIELPMQR